MLQPLESGRCDGLQGDRRTLSGAQQPMPAIAAGQAAGDARTLLIEAGRRGTAGRAGRKRQRQGVTLCGRPKAGLPAHRRSMTSCSSAFCPLYVVRMLIWFAGYPASLQRQAQTGCSSNEFCADGLPAKAFAVILVALAHEPKPAGLCQILDVKDVELDHLELGVLNPHRMYWYRDTRYSASARFWKK